MQKHSIQVVWVRKIKGIWNNKKWKFIFHIVDAQGPVLLGLKIPGDIGLFMKTPIV